MKITAIEIRQKEFEKNFRGYDKDEVQAFLTSLSSAWEKMNEENKELKIRLENAEHEVKKLREVENSLFKTLKTAEDTGNNLIEQASKSAELQVKEAQMQSDSMLHEAREKSKSITEQAESIARETIDSLQSEMKELEQQYRKLEDFRDTFISELKHAAGDLHEKIDRMKLREKNFEGFKNELSKAKARLQANFADPESGPAPKPSEATVTEKKEDQPTPKSKPDTSDDDRSFFDDIS